MFPPRDAVSGGALRAAGYFHIIFTGYLFVKFMLQSMFFGVKIYLIRRCAEVRRVKETCLLLEILEGGGWGRETGLVDSFLESFAFPLLQEALASLKRDALYMSHVHGVGHIERTMLHGAMGAAAEPLSEKDARLLLTMCAYHDTGRVCDYLDGAHGARSAGKLAALTGLAGEDLKEATAGVESTLPGGRVHLAAKFFYKQTTDAFLAYCFGRKTADTYLWRYSSRTPYFDTASAFYTTGVEFDADAVLVDRDDFRWTAGLNFTWMTGRMTQKGELDLNGQDVGSGLIVNKLVAGRPVAEFYNTQTSLGSPVPGILGGLTTTVRWRQFIVEADLSGAALFQVVDLSSVVIPDAGPVVLDKDCVRSGDYLKLGRLSLAYDLIPAGLPFIRRIRFSLSGNNLLLLAARTDIPPMLDYFGWNGATSGMAFAAFPYARSIVAGISVTF